MRVPAWVVAPSWALAGPLSSRQRALLPRASLQFRPVSDAPEAAKASPQWQRFAGLSPEVTAPFLAVAVRRRYSKGEVIFHEGDPGEAVHLVEKGKVAVRVSTPLGEVTTLAIRGPGDFFGELALLGPVESRSATVVALSPTETLVVRRGDMERLLVEHPRLLRLLVELLAARVRALGAQVLESRLVAADVRVRRRLLELSADDDGTGSSSVVSATQEELAGLAGTTRGTVNRVLAEEAKRGTLTTARGRITVLDRAGIARRAK